MNDLIDGPPVPQAAQPEPAPVIPPVADAPAPDFNTLIAGLSARIDVLETRFIGHTHEFKDSASALGREVAEGRAEVDQIKEAFAELDGLVLDLVETATGLTGRVVALEIEPPAPAAVADPAAQFPDTDPEPIAQAQPSVPIVAGEPRGKKMRW